ncbi:hypothetical protein FNV43_RR01903 [Rhamnella rubrinervis]|uniref:SAC3/GANP/THP3 conserved domain-containing protein n=1 Tax=Rhamnella rubrinervis TaxID=2594499 RepID=A0A8K0HQH3_9ROSA|nr:hypothetical protein FNV43_RR01903 [Rhamnella rubrinervis]
MLRHRSRSVRMRQNFETTSFGLVPQPTNPRSIASFSSYSLDYKELMRQSFLGNGSWFLDLYCHHLRDGYAKQKERCKKHEQSRSILNVSEEILGMLSRKNPDAGCLCWKLIICSHLNNPEEDKLGQRNLAAGSWLLSKLMLSSKMDYDAGLVISSAGLSIWKKCVPNQLVFDLTCCWSVVKDANFNNLTETLSGASAVLFIASESIPWKLQKDKLHTLLLSIPCGSCLPLLILDPNDLVLAFNKALDQSLGEFSRAAEANHTGWPCPEISILEFSRTMESHVPKVGRSEVDKIQPIISALEECKLPAFSADLSCLASGSNSVEDIENNIVKLKNCLVKYLTEESKMMGLEFAIKEAHVLLQISFRLEHRGSLVSLIFSRGRPLPEPKGFLLKTTPNGDVEVHEAIHTTDFMQEESSFDQRAMASDVSDIKGVSNLSGRDSVVGSHIRLHIIAMHELCEYPKGEGFYEGFDAHLNIEQMNKTSVELFQLYDDHRKKGIHIPTEKEFRGYYALLKLDKHPGYTVEPAEFSLDLAKMTPQIRLTSEVMFARKVSRACGIGNYISFFRLARKASYLQACLSTLTLQSYGRKHLPFCMLVSRITRESLLPMLEEEDLESLLEYHGFLIKVFNEPYMVKEGPFLNFDKEYPTRRSKLVDLKRSGRIIEDVLPSTQVISMHLKAPKETQMGKNDPKSVPPVERESSSCDIPAIEVDGTAHALDEEMPDSQAAPSQKESIQIQPTFETPVVYQQSKDNHQMAGILSLPWGSSSVRVDSPGIPKDDTIFGKTLHSGTGTETKITLKPHAEEEPRVYKNVENSVPQIILNQLEDEVPPDLLRENDNDDLMENDQQEETAEAKLKLIIRLWKRQSSKQRELREQRQVAANAALQSLSIGLPIYLQKDQPSVSGEFDIGQFLTERCKKLEQSRSILNVSGEILEEDKLGQMNFAAGSWLLSKLMPSRKPDYDAGLVISSAGLSIWKKCVPNQSVLDLTCCCISWKLQKDKLHNLLLSIPSGSCLPLLILSDSYKDEVSDLSSFIINELGLHHVDQSWISSFRIVFLVENQQIEHLNGFFSDKQLREGLQWLASESPQQPVLHYVRTRELVLTHLNSSLEVLKKLNDYEIGPNNLVLAFNKALDQSLGEISSAAEANHTGWPCPEISILEFCEEFRTMESHVPKVGWSEVDKIQPIISALEECKLPAFSADLSCLASG